MESHRSSSKRVSSTRSSFSRRTSNAGSTRVSSNRPVSTKRESVRSSAKHASSRASLKRASTRSTSKRSSLRSTGSVGSRRVSRHKAQDPMKQAWENTIQPALAGFFTNWVVPFVCTVFTVCAVFNAVVLSYVCQKIVKLWDNRDLRKLNKLHQVQKLGAIFHELFGFIAIDMNPFWKRVVKYDVKPKDLPKNAIFMGNHVSFSDPWFLCGVLPESKAVGQAPIFDIPIVGSVLEECGDMPVHFERKPNGRWGTRKGTKEFLVEKSSKYLRNNIPIAVMPEGSITKDGNLLPFKPGFFEIAVKNDAPIVPMCLWGNQAAWPMVLDKTKDFSTPERWLYPATVHVHVGTPIYPKGRTPQELMEVVRDTIDNMRVNMPNYNGNSEYYTAR